MVTNGCGTSNTRVLLFLATAAASALAACGSSTPTASTAGSTARATPTPTAELTAPLTIAAAWTVSDVASVNLKGSTVPAAAVSATPTAGTQSISAVADDAGAFTIHVAGLTLGDNGFGISVIARGYSNSFHTVTVTRTQSEASLKASAAVIPYPSLSKDPAALAGRIVTSQAQVFQYDTNTTTSHFIASVTNDGYGYWSDNVWADLDPTIAQAVCAKTVIRFWGTVVGAYTYTTTSNGSLTIPEVKVQYLTVVSHGC